MTTYYIDYENGNNTTGDGSSGLPWKTLAKFLSSASNNDTCLVRGNSAEATIYYEAGLSTVLTGLTVTPDTGHAPIFTPSTKFTSWALTSGSVYEAACNLSAVYQAFNGATQLTSTASVVACEALENSYFFDDGNNKLHAHIAGGGSPSQINAVDNVNALVNSAGANVTYDNLIVQWCCAGLTLDAAGTISDCTIRYHGPTVGLGDRNAITIGNTTGTATVSGCTISGTYAAPAGEGTRGIRQTAAGTLSVSNTTMTGMRYGYLMSSGVNGTATINGCTISNCGDGITVEGGATITILNTTIYAFEHGAYQIGGTGAVGVVHHCTAYFSGSLAHANGFIAETSATATFEHNVCYGLESASGNGYGFLAQNNGTTVTAQNNISMNNKIGFMESSGTVTYTSDYNCGYSNSSADWTTWPTAAHDIVVDPLFVDAAAADFNLDPESDCINAGVYVAGINDGYSGSAPDIGRYEYVPEVYEPDKVRPKRQRSRRLWHSVSGDYWA